MATNHLVINENDLHRTPEPTPFTKDPTPFSICHSTDHPYIIHMVTTTTPPNDPLQNPAQAKPALQESQ
jgi:hypothetical protein